MIEIKRALAMNSTGWMALFQGKLEEAIPLLEEGLALFRRLEDTAGTAAAPYNLGVTLVACLEYERAEALLVEAADLQRTLREPASVARSLQALSLVALAQQRYGQAMKVAEEGLMLSRGSDDRVGIVLQDCSLALAQLGRGKHEQAEVRCADALRTALGLKWEHGVAMSLQVSGAIAGSREQAIRATRIWGAAGALRAAIGATLSPFVGVNRQGVYEIVNEKRRVSAEMALRLARWSGMTPRFWLGIQEHYDLEVAKMKSGEKIEREVKPLPLA